MPGEEHKEIAIVERAEGIMNPDESLSGSARANPAAPAADGTDEAARGSLGGQQNRGGDDDDDSLSNEDSIPELSSSTARIPVPRFQLRRQPSGTHVCLPLCVYMRMQGWTRCART